MDAPKAKKEASEKEPAADIYVVTSHHDNLFIASTDTTLGRSLSMVELAAFPSRRTVVREVDRNRALGSFFAGSSFAGAHPGGRPPSVFSGRERNRCLPIGACAV
jgi:hypothetical protein